MLLLLLNVFDLFLPRPAVNVDPLRWDVCNLPLRDESVDVFLTDLVCRTLLHLCIDSPSVPYLNKYKTHNILQVPVIR